MSDDSHSRLHERQADAGDEPAEPPSVLPHPAR
jgi:hypothetical protein